MLEFRILGPLEVVDRDKAARARRPEAARGARALLLDAGRVVSTDYLIDALWGEQPPRTAATSLQNFVSQLRKAARPRASSRGRPATCSGRAGAARPRPLRAARRGGARRRRRRSGRGTLREALALWRGEPLADFAYEPFAQTEIAPARGAPAVARRGAHRRRARARPRTPSSSRELEALVAEHPLRERLRGAADARALPLGPAGGGARGLPGRAPRARRRARASSRARSSGSCTARSCARRPARAPAPAARPRTITSREVAARLLAGRLVPVLGSDVGDLAAQLAPSASRTRPTSEAPDPRLAVRRGDEGLRPALRRAARAARAEARADAGPPLLRLAAAAAARARRPHQLIVTTSYDLALEQAFLERARSSTSSPTSPPAGTAASSATSRPTAPRADRAPEHVRDRAVARAAHGHPQAPRRLRPDAGARVGELRRHRGRLHRLPRADRRLGERRAGRARREAPPQPLPLPRLHDADWNLRVVLSRLWGDDPLSYRSWAVQPERAAARARVLAPPRRRRARGAARGVRRGARRARLGVAEAERS